MPYLGLSSFLLIYEQHKRKYREGFNALPRAFFFSTELKAIVFYVNFLFQCPTSGFLLFYAMSLHPLNLLALQIHFCV